MLICLGGIRGHTNLFDIFGVFSRGFGVGKGRNSLERLPTDIT